MTGKSYELVANGVAILPILGEFTTAGDSFGVFQGMGLWASIAASLDRAAQDKRVCGLVLDIDSNGGVFGGSIETAAAVRAFAAVKPVVAYINGHATGEGYALAAAANEIVVEPSATLGGIGVAALHLDRSGELERAGVKPTLLHAGARKVDGSPLQPLSERARGALQDRVTYQYQLTIDGIGAHRPALGAAGARATDGATYIGAKAVSAKLADRIGTLRDAAARAHALAQERAKPRAPSSASPAPKKPTILPNATLPAPLPTAPARPVAPASVSALSSTVAADAGSERVRIAAILNHEEARNRQGLARALAFDTNMTLEQAVAALKCAGVENRGSRMDRVPIPKIGPDFSSYERDPQADAEAVHAEIAAKLNATLPPGAIVPASAANRRPRRS